MLGLTALFVLTVGLEDFEPIFGVNVDSPASSTHEALTSFGNDVGLEPAELLAIVGGLLGVALVFALRRLPRRQLAATVLAALVAFVFAETAYTWNRLLESSGPSGRRLTAAQADQLSWIDNAVEDGSVAMFAYSFGQDWYPSAVAFWDVEFWNARVDRAYRLDGYFTYTPETFPTPSVRIDPRTGLFVGRRHAGLHRAHAARRALRPCGNRGRGGAAARARRPRSPTPRAVADARSRP